MSRTAFPLLVLVITLGACNGGRASLGVGDGQGDGGVDSGSDAGLAVDGGTSSGLDSGVDAGTPVDGGPDAGNSDDAGNDGWGACGFNITPTSINFGQVRPDTLEDGGVIGGISFNFLGPNACLFTNLHLSPDTDPVFYLVNGPISSAWLGGDAGFSLQVTIAARSPGPSPGIYSIVLIFTVDDSSTPTSISIPFSFAYGSSCFVLKPATLDFGTVTRGPCPGDHQLSFVAINACAQEVTLQSLILDGGAFVLIDGQVPQVVAQGGMSSPFTVEFPGGEDGTTTGTLSLQTDLQNDPFAPFSVALTATVVAGTAQIDTFNFSGNYLFSLSGTPDRDGPAVVVNGTVLREGFDWSFDPLTNVVAIDSTWRTLNDGDVVQISYHLACG